MSSAGPGGCSLPPPGSPLDGEEKNYPMRASGFAHEIGVDAGRQAVDAGHVLEPPVFAQAIGTLCRGPTLQVVSISLVFEERNGHAAGGLHEIIIEGDDLASAWQRLGLLALDTQAFRDEGPDHGRTAAE